LQKAADFEVRLARTKRASCGTALPLFDVFGHRTGAAALWLITTTGLKANQ